MLNIEDKLLKEIENLEKEVSLLESKRVEKSAVNSLEKDLLNNEIIALKAKNKKANDLIDKSLSLLKSIK